MDVCQFRWKNRHCHKKHVCRQEEKRKFSLRLMEFAKIPYILTFQTYLDHCLSTRARDFHNSDDVHSFFPLSKKTKISKWIDFISNSREFTQIWEISLAWQNTFWNKFDWCLKRTSIVMQIKRILEMIFIKIWQWGRAWIDLPFGIH